MMTAVKLKQANDADGPRALGAAPLKILLADDHALFRAGLRHLLSHIGAELEIEEAHDLEDAVHRLGTLKDLDLLLLDLNMPGMEGFAGVRRLCELAPDVPVIVISVRDGPRDVRQAIGAGAMGFIPKSSTPEVMISALQLVLSGGVYLPPNLLHEAVPDGPGQTPEPDEADSDLLRRLTPRQRDVLHLLARGQSNKQIAEGLGLAPGTVKIHISRILRAFKVKNRTQAVITATDLLDGGAAVK